MTSRFDLAMSCPHQQLNQKSLTCLDCRYYSDKQYTPPHSVSSVDVFTLDSDTLE